MRPSVRVRVNSGARLPTLEPTGTSGVGSIMGVAVGGGAGIGVLVGGVPGEEVGGCSAGAVVGGASAVLLSTSVCSGATVAAAAVVGDTPCAGSSPVVGLEVGSVPEASRTEVEVGPGTS